MLSSPEMADSGNIRGGAQKSNFSQTCSLLSQYLKENGSFGDLSISLSPNFQSHDATKWLPQQTSVTNLESKKGQMTIFYGGQVIVLDEFPADKLNEIMSISGTQHPNIYYLGQKSAESATNFVNKLVHQNSPIISPLPMFTDLPITRKASLARFFEKRKDRLTEKAPYQTRSTGSTSNPAAGKGKPWLGFGAQPPTQIEHEAYLV